MPKILQVHTNKYDDDEVTAMHWLNKERDELEWNNNKVKRNGNYFDNG